MCKKFLELLNKTQNINLYIKTYFVVFKQFNTILPAQAQFFNNFHMKIELWLLALSVNYVLS